MDINKYIAEKIKYYRERKNITQQEMAEYLHTTQQSVARYESGERKTNQDVLFALAKYFNISINDFFPEFDNGHYVDINLKSKIPVLGIIKAGKPIEAQENILDYIDIPSDWLRGGKKFFALKISGDSMFPKYDENDVVIFEQSDDNEFANGRDCAVMVNGWDATFKNILINSAGITLIPLNMNNEDGFKPTFYNSEQVDNLPVRIIGIAVEKRTKIN